MLKETSNMFYKSYIKVIFSFCVHIFLISNQKWDFQLNKETNFATVCKHLMRSKGRSILFNHFIDMRTTDNLSISCRKNKLMVVLISIKWLNKIERPLELTTLRLSHISMIEGIYDWPPKAEEEVERRFFAIIFWI